MARKCSHCGNIGHNSRTCTNYRGNVGIGGLKLFGVRLDVTNYSSNSYSSSSTCTFTSLKKSFSMECLSSSTPSSPSPSSSLCSTRLSAETYSDKASVGYLSDGLFGREQERKKGVAWTEGEHMAFLVGLEKLGKGDWRGISRSFVTTRTPTQVASHAQKYFLRLATLDKKKRRSSLFDMVSNSQSNSHSNSKPDDQYQNFSPRNVTSHHMTSPLPSLNSSDQLMGFRGFGGSQLPRTSMAADQFFKPISPDDDDNDDLELTLGAPIRTTSASVEGNKSSSSLPFTRHIRVT